jgi:hypothetical protein
MSLVGSHTDVVFADVLVPPGPAPKASFERVRFERCTFTGAGLAGWQLDDVALRPVGAHDGQPGRRSASTRGEPRTGRVRPRSRRGL